MLRRDQHYLVVVIPTPSEAEAGEFASRLVPWKRRTPFALMIDAGALRVDADRGKDSAREVREYFIPDFGNWKDHDSYQTALQRLVKDLKAEAASSRQRRLPKIWTEVVL